MAALRRSALALGPQLGRRQYSALASPLSQPLKSAKESHAPLPPQDVQVSKLSSGLVVASLEDYSPVSKVALLVRAGSRYETSDNLGITHCLRTYANLTTKGASTFRITRAFEELGANFNVLTTREHIMYVLDCQRDHVDNLMELLVNVTLAQEFRPWELQDAAPRLKLEKALALLNPTVGVMENLHAAAFKNTLANSLYCPDFMIGAFSQDMLHDYVQHHYTSARMALVGVGVEHKLLKQLAEQFLNVRGGIGSSSVKATYVGGNVRVHGSGELTHAAVASEGAPWGTPEARALSLLQHVLGAGPCIKRGTDAVAGKIGGAIAKVVGHPFAASAFNSSYRDSGLFGIYAVCNSGEVDKVLQAAVGKVKAIAEGNLSAGEFQRAQNQLKASLLMGLEGREALVDELSTQVLETSSYTALPSVLQAIDAVKSADVIAAAKKFVTGKKTVAANGNLRSTPFADEL
uniref:Cytochrome b-c1 complex subunit 2, mitochondrial n=2 Tax=Petromyzon marinus TaxID=7757 RepID=A0AAJ7UBW8_PETMA|nr:cytochrome b-c1 complex subunit 2, mitochondrial [Petromyzon marinus]